MSGGPGDAAHAPELELAQVAAHLVLEVLPAPLELVRPVEVLQELRVPVSSVHVDVEHVRARSVVSEDPLEVGEFGCPLVDKSKSFPANAEVFEVFAQSLNLLPPGTLQWY